MDRERLQDVVDQAGRPDLLVPATIDGAMVSVNVPRSITLQYGDCEPHVDRQAKMRTARRKNGMNGDKRERTEYLRGAD